jgi:hypothetical protein
MAMTAITRNHCGFYLFAFLCSDSSIAPLAADYGVVAKQSAFAAFPSVANLLLSGSPS